jgi:hypothetical protein
MCITLKAEKLAVMRRTTLLRCVRHVTKDITQEQSGFPEQFIAV